MKRVFRSGDLSEKDPTWYWTGGLHDARICSTEALELPYDYREKNPIRNCFKIHLNATSAFCNKTIKSISLFNYKILCDGSAKGGYAPGRIDGCFWMQDLLKFDNGKYVLEIILLGEDDFPFTIRFDDAMIEQI